MFRCVSSSLKATKSHFRCSIFIYTAPPLCFFIHTVGGGVGGGGRVVARGGGYHYTRQRGWGGEKGARGVKKTICISISV